MSLPLTWTDKIFQKLTLAYGREFTSRWEGIPLEEVKSDWGHELTGYAQSPQSITYALQNLPLKPPTVYEFRAICQRAAEKPLLQLDAPRTSPAAIQSALKTMTAPVRSGMKDWAHKLKARHDAGENLNANQVRCYRAALQTHEVAA